MKLPAASIRSRLPLVSAALSLAVAGSLAWSARPAVTVSGATSANCQPGAEGNPGSCVDPIGDAKGPVAGPDITRVMEYEWGAIAFRVTFAKAPPLTHTNTHTDEVSVSLTASGKTTKQYLLTLSATDLKHQFLQRLPNGKRFTLPAAGNVVSGRTVVLSVNLHSIGDPNTVRYRVRAARVMLDGTPGSSDYVPNQGTMVWRGSRPLGR